MNKKPPHHARLLISPSSEQLEEHAQHLASDILCANASAQNKCHCPTCQSVRARKHPSLCWISPQSGSYTLNDIKLLAQFASTQRSETDPAVIVMEHVDYLRAATANRLLKQLEEPTPYCFFIMLSSNANNVLSTITSRSHVVIISTTESLTTPSPLIDWFNQALHGSAGSAAAFDRLINDLQLDVTTTTKILNAMIRQTQSPHTSFIHQRLFSFISHLLSTLPAQLNGKLFWRMVYCEVVTILAQAKAQERF